MQISLGLPDPRDEPSLPYLKRVQAGIRRAQLNRAVPLRVRLPVTASLLEQTRVVLDDSTYLHKIVVWVVACAAFFWLFQAWRTPPGLTFGIQLSNVIGLERRGCG